MVSSVPILKGFDPLPIMKGSTKNKGKKDVTDQLDWERALPCDPDADSSCVRDWIRSLGMRVFRRPLKNRLAQSALTSWT